MSTKEKTLTAYDFSRIEKEARTRGEEWRAEMAATFRAVFAQLSQLLPGFLLCPEVDGQILTSKKAKYEPGAEEQTLTYDSEKKAVGLSIATPGTSGTWLMALSARVDSESIVLHCGEHPVRIPLGVWSSPDTHAKDAWEEAIARVLTLGLRDLAALIATRAAEEGCLKPFLHNTGYFRKVLNG